MEKWWFKRHWAWGQNQNACLIVSLLAHERKTKEGDIKKICWPVGILPCNIMLFRIIMLFKIKVGGQENDVQEFVIDGFKWKKNENFVYLAISIQKGSYVAWDDNNQISSRGTRCWIFKIRVFWVGKKPNYYLSKFHNFQLKLTRTHKSWKLWNKRGYKPISLNHSRLCLFILRTKSKYFVYNILCHLCIQDLMWFILDPNWNVYHRIIL